jgi:large subunit ribosomal protein L7A
MELKDLETARIKKIGIKQSMKAISNGEAAALFVAKDSEQHVVRNILKLAEDKNVLVVYVDNMLALGKACNIDVGAATAVIVK